MGAYTYKESTYKESAQVNKFQWTPCIHIKLFLNVIYRSLFYLLQFFTGTPSP